MISFLKHLGWLIDFLVNIDQLPLETWAHLQPCPVSLVPLKSWIQDWAA